MDKKYQDIHYRHNGSEKDVIVYRHVTIHNVRFKENSIEIDITDYEFYPLKPLPILSEKTIIIPKLTGYSLIID